MFLRIVAEMTTECKHRDDISFSRQIVAPHRLRLCLFSVLLCALLELAPLVFRTQPDLGVPGRLLSILVSLGNWSKHL